MTILRIDASGRHDGSVTREITDRVIARLGDADVITRDLAETPPTLVDQRIIGSYFTPPDQRTAEQSEAIAPSDAVVDELMRADTVVVGMPIYNFGAPAALKGWADMAARAGVTFKYEADGPKGLLEGKRAIVVVASGGTGVDSEIDWATPWLRFFLGFIGIHDVTVIAAGRMNADKNALERAYADVDALTEMAA